MLKFKIIYFLAIFSIIISCNDSDDEKNKSESKIIGETISFKNFEENNLIKKNISNLLLYSLNKNGSREYYIKDIDYSVVNNKVKRKEGSRIPNAASRITLLNEDNTFTFFSNPRNPELTIPYQVYADYNFSDVELVKGKFNEGFLSSNFRYKLKDKKNIRIAIVGTSISAGGHTFAQFYQDSDKDSYAYLVAKAIKNKFGSESIIDNFSLDGSTLSQVDNSFDSIIEGEYDLIFIEFGMNDHIHATWSEGLTNFEMKMSKIVKKSLDSNLSVVLIGFFQQNPAWDLEFSGSTVAYNQALARVANSYHCYFANIYQEFSKYSQTKINNDFCGDFMHHPTTFGHLLYYKTIMPIFLENDTNDGVVYQLIK